ncbi:hypothetical protein OQA88_3177 [Cercophora sp. LCS_1]
MAGQNTRGGARRVEPRHHHQQSYHHRGPRDVQSDAEAPKPVFEESVVAFSQSTSPPEKSPTQDHKGKRRGCQAILWFICSNTGLAFIYYGIAKARKWDPPEEEEKVAMNKNRGTALFRGIIHLIPVAGCLVLIYLNASSYYVGGELAGWQDQDFQKLAALQFAAKIHELFMLASLGLIIVTRIRRELIFGEGLPFGAIFVPSGFTNISFLWSQAFGGICFQDWQRSSRKVFSIIMIIICSILGLAVGPSSATLIRPQLAEWLGGGTPFWINATHDQLFPAVIAASAVSPDCINDTGDLSCPAGNWRTLQELYFPYWPLLGPRINGNLPKEIPIQSRYSLRTLHIITRAPHIWDNAYTAATTQVSPLADAIAELGRIWSIAAFNSDTSRLKFRRNAFWMVEAEQPVVFARCVRQLVEDPIPNAKFPLIDSIDRVDGLADSAGLRSMLPVNESSAIQNRLSQPLPSVIWYDGVELMKQLNSSIACIVAVPESNVGPGEFYTCSVSAAYGSSIYRSAWSPSKIVSGSPGGFATNGIFNATHRAVSVDAAWARYLNPTNPSTETTAVSEIMRSAGLWNSTSPTPNDSWEPLVESILATLVANGMSRIGYSAELQMDDLFDREKMLPPGRGLGGGSGEAFTEPSNPSAFSKFNLFVHVEGYAYSPDGGTQVVTMAILGAYVFLVAVHFLWTLWTGWSSGPWGSPPEVAAIALQSSAPAALANTGAGIDTVKVFESRVQVKVLDGKLEMAFDDTGKPGHERAVENKAYR